MVGKRLKKYFLNRRPATGLHGVRLLHNNASSHKAAIVREYLMSSFRTLLIRQILPLVTFSYSRGSKNTSLEENIKRAKILVRLFFSVRTVYLETIMKMHLKIGLKDWNFVYHMVAIILKDWDKDLALFVKRFWKLT